MHTPITSQLDSPASLAGSITPQPITTATGAATLQLNRIKAWGQQRWQRLVHYWSNPPELQVWQRRDRSGRLHWQTYDPYTNQSASFGSEADVKAWIDEHLAQRQFANQHNGWGAASIDVCLHQTSPFR